MRGEALSLVHTHQDGTTVSAFAFDRRIGRFQRRRRRGHRFNKRRWNDLERPLWKSGHCCHQFQIRCMRSIHHAVYSLNCSAAIPPQLSQTGFTEEAGSVQCCWRVLAFSAGVEKAPQGSKTLNTPRNADASLTGEAREARAVAPTHRYSELDRSELDRSDREIDIGYRCVMARRSIVLIG